MKKLVTLIIAFTAAGLSEAAMAYVGPGAGLSLLGALWGLVLALAAALAFVILWPLRRYRRRRADAGEGAYAEARDQEFQPDRRQRRDERRPQDAGPWPSRSAADDPEHPWLPSKAESKRRASAGRN